MTEFKTELASLEEHNDAVQKTIQRRAHKSYELDDFTDGHDQDQWFGAERESMILDIPFSIENEAILVRLAMEKFPPSTLVISVSSRSLLIFCLRDDASNDCEDSNRDLLRVILLPAEVDSARLTCEMDDGDLALRLPLAPGALTVSTSECIW